MDNVHSCHKCESIYVNSEDTSEYQKQYMLNLTDFLRYGNDPEPCPFFAMLSAACSWPEGYFDTIKPNSKVVIQFDSHIDSSTCLSVGTFPRRGFTGIADDRSSDKYGELVALTCQIVADAENPAAVDVPGRVLPSEFDAETIAMIQTWYSECRGKHAKCQQIRYTPRRLLYVGGPNDHRMSLKEFNAQSQMEVDSYAALSYIWGDPQQSRTTQANLNSRLQSIDIDELPLTLKDAVVVCRALGLPWLWVDVLCIIQDDSQDKAEQINMMGTIYESAAVTLVAATSRSSSDGFLSTTFNNAIVLFVSLRHRPSNQEEGSIYLIKKPKSQPNFAIEHRGWTMQERLLSRRLLFFHDGRIDWVCRTVHLFAGCTSSYSVNIIDETLTTPSRHFEPLEISTNEFTAGELHRWYSLASSFSERQLTNPQDRLPAISGIAKEFKRYSHSAGAYVAGLWTTKLAEQLLWRRAIHSSVACRSIFYIAPSWSWAATETEFFLPTFATAGAAVRLQILEAKTQPVQGSDRYGQLAGAHLGARGRLKVAHWNISKQTIEAEDGLSALGNTHTEVDTLDYAPEGPRAGTSIQVYCLEIQDARYWAKDFKTGWGPSYTGLLLLLYPGRSMTFERVGVFSLANVEEDEDDYAIIQSAVGNLAWFENTDSRDLILI